MERALAILVTVLGVVGFTSGFWLTRTGVSLNAVELPAVFQTTTFELLDGGRLTASQPLQRLQIYNRDGRFVRGWFVDAAGGSYLVSLTAVGEIAICSARGARLTFYDFSGATSRPASICRFAGGGAFEPTLLTLANLPTGQPVLNNARVVSSPPLTLATALMFPLWHPFVAWALAAAGGIWLGWIRRRT